jgi:NAD-dependent SIR2 family protein deacetylase
VNRYNESWQAYTCSDCEEEYDKPYVMVVPEGDPVPEHCPRCGSYLGLCTGDRGLRIANTPAERYAQKQHGDGA